ncbi:hypothetical protein EXIGLDRAFT_731697 [Exidia glandulosa HHB12029]|uniref:Uncharacterized protein n=1 Tax=Exidia glandulosa HHB12029 TaxID=1314781 RepID=A0A165BS44_EXIGL|nr:hypothetical protein EXIGLDRAFT_731697 [Exidia glandulosa HHB12029]
MTRGSQIPSFALKAPERSMGLGWRLSRAEIVEIVGDDTQGDELSDLVGLKWGANGGAFGDSPYVDLAEDRGYYILMAHCGWGPFTEEFIKRHVLAVKKLLNVPDAVDKTFGWHRTR